MALVFRRSSGGRHDQRYAPAQPQRDYRSDNGDAGSRFAQPGVAEDSATGAISVTVDAGTFLWLPAKIRVPAGRPVAEPLEAPVGPAVARLDRLGLWTIIAVVLVIEADAYPIITHLAMPRFGSPGASPF